MRLSLSAALHIAALAMLTLAASCSKGKDAAHDAALVVNGQTITQSQVDEAAEFFRQSQAALFPERLFESGDAIRQAAARQLVANILMTAEVKSRGWLADSALVGLTIERFIAQFPSRELFLSQLAEMGESEESMRKEIEESLLVDSLLSIVSAAAETADEGECNAYYEKNKSRYVEPGRARASHILFKLDPAASDSLVQTVIVKANEALNRARAGDSFDALIAEYSSTPKNGDMGWFKRGDLIPDIERELFTMNKGDISNLAPSSMGIHILKKTDEEGPRQLGYAEAAADVKNALEAEKKSSAVNAYVDSLLSAAKIQYIDTTLVMKTEEQ